jgi:sterol-4alpha-carboxylate 3-dehydrogenase (decarboxylating)
VKPDVVINTASPPWHGKHELLRKVNIDGTRTLVEVAGGKHGDWGGKCKAFVHTSSSSVVHDGESDLLNADERYPYVCPNPWEYYSETKVYAEKLALDANDKPEYGHMLTCAIRPAGIVGEGDRAGFSYGICKQASASASWQLHIQLGSGDNLFDNTYVHNVAYALLLAAQALLATYQRRLDGKALVLDHEKVDGEAFNITNDSPANFWDSGRFIYSRYGREINMKKVWVLPAGLAELVGGAAEAFNWLTGRQGRLTRQTVKYALINRYYSCEKAKERLGYFPIVPIDEGILRSIKWFKDDEEAEKQKSSGEKKVQ